MPDPSSNRVKYKPCDFILERKDARDSPRWNRRWYDPAIIRPVTRVLIYDIYLAKFAEKANATGQNLASVLHQLKDM